MGGVMVSSPWLDDYGNSFYSRGLRPSDMYHPEIPRALSNILDGIREQSRLIRQAQENHRQLCAMYDQMAHRAGMGARASHEIQEAATRMDPEWYARYEAEKRRIEGAR